MIQQKGGRGTFFNCTKTKRLVILKGKRFLFYETNKVESQNFLYPVLAKPES